MRFDDFPYGFQIGPDGIGFVVGISPRQGFETAADVDQRQFAVNGVGQRNPVPAVFRGSENKPVEIHNPRIEVDPAAAVNGEFVFDFIGAVLDGRQRLRRNRVAERDDVFGDVRPHFRFVVSGKRKRIGMPDIIDRPELPLKPCPNRFRDNLFGNHHPGDKLFGRKGYFRSHGSLP